MLPRYPWRPFFLWRGDHLPKPTVQKKKRKGKKKNITTTLPLSNTVIWPSGFTSSRLYVKGLRKIDGLTRGFGLLPLLASSPGPTWEMDSPGDNGQSCKALSVWLRPLFAVIELMFRIFLYMYPISHKCKSLFYVPLFLLP